MKGQVLNPKITTLFAYICEGEDAEYIPVLKNTITGLLAPMFFVSQTQAEEMKPQAQEVANTTGSNLRLVTFLAQETITTVTPEPH